MMSGVTPDQLQWAAYYVSLQNQGQQLAPEQAQWAQWYRVNYPYGHAALAWGPPPEAAVPVVAATPAAYGAPAAASAPVAPTPSLPSEIDASDPAWRAAESGHYPGQLPGELKYHSITRQFRLQEEGSFQLISGGNKFSQGECGLQIWDVNAGMPVRTFDLPSGVRMTSYDVASTLNNGAALIAGKEQSFFALRDLNTFAELDHREFTNQKDVNACAIVKTSTGSFVGVFGGEDAFNLQLFDLGTFKPLRNIQVSHSGSYPRTVDILADPVQPNLVWAVGQVGGSLTLNAFDINSSSLVPIKTFVGLTFQGYGSQGYRGSYTGLGVGAPPGSNQSFVIGGSTTMAKIWDFGTGKVLRTLNSRSGFGGISACQNIAVVANNDSPPALGLSYFDLTTPQEDGTPPISFLPGNAGAAMLSDFYGLAVGTWGTVAAKAHHYVFVAHHERPRKKPTSGGSGQSAAYYPYG